MAQACSLYPWNLTQGLTHFVECYMIKNNCEIL